MGTSTNYAGSPNWGPAKSETTRVAGEGHVTPQKTASIVSNFVGEMARSPQLGFGSGGGGSSGSGGRGGNGGGGGGGGSSGRGGGGGGGRRSGGSARSVGQSIGQFLADVQTKGFKECLAEKGLTDLDGKSPDEIALALADLLGMPTSLIEQTALRDALNALVLEWSEGVSGIDGLTESVTAAAQNIEATLHSFFGHYILEVFKTVGCQGVMERYGLEKADSMVGQIRDFIGEKLSELEHSRSLSSVDWNGSAGAAIVQGIVADTVAIFTESTQ